MGDLPEVGVRLIAKDVEQFIKDVGRAQQAADELRAKLAQSMSLKFSAVGPTSQEYASIKQDVTAAAANISKSAVIKFKAEAPTAQVKAALGQAEQVVARGSYQFQLTAKEAAVANKVLARQHGGIARVADYPELGELTPFTRYEDDVWFAERKRVDDLDQVTFSRKQSIKEWDAERKAAEQAIQQSVEAGAAVQQNAVANATIQKDYLSQIARLEEQTEKRRVSAMAPAERLEYEYNQRLTERRAILDELDRTGGNEAQVAKIRENIAAEQALYEQQSRRYRKTEEGTPTQPTRAQAVTPQEIIDREAVRTRALAEREDIRTRAFAEREAISTQAIADREAVRLQTQAEKDALKKSSRAATDTQAGTTAADRVIPGGSARESNKALRTAEIQRNNALIAAQREAEQAQNAEWAGLSRSERMRLEYERDRDDLARKMSGATDSASAMNYADAIQSRYQKYQTDLDNFNRGQQAAIEKSIGSFKDEVRGIGVSRGQSFYVFQGLEDQKKDFEDRMAKTRKDFGEGMSADQEARLKDLSDQYAKLYAEGITNAEQAVGGRLRQQYYEQSFMGQLAREETKTYGARILAGELQRFGAMAFAGGIGVTVGSQRLVDQYMTEYRVPLGRVQRALDLSPDMREDLDTLLLDRAGKQSFQTATDQADAMRKWAEAINVTVDSYDDLISVTGGVETGLAAQTDLISSLVKLNEGSGTLEQTVTDVAAIMTQYNLVTQDAATQTENLQQVVGLLDTAASSGLAELNDIGSSMKFFSGRAYELGIALPEAVSVIEMLAQVGLKGSQAGRGVDQLLKSIVAPTPKAVGVFSSLLEPFYGEDWQQGFFDAEGQFKGMANFLQEMARATSGMSDQKRQSSLAGIGDANAVRTLNALLIRTNEAYAEGIDYLGVLTQLRESGIQGIEKEVAALERLTGIDFGDLSAVESYEMRLESLRQQIETIYSQAMVRLETSMLKFGKSMSDTVVPILDDAANILDRIASFAEKNPDLMGLLVKGGIGLAGTGLLSMALGTATRGAVDIMTLRNAYIGARGATQGLPMMTRLMGLTTNQEKALVAAFKIERDLSGDQTKAIIREAARAPLTDTAKITEIIQKAAQPAGAAAATAGAGAAAAGIQRAADAAARSADASAAASLGAKGMVKEVAVGLPKALIAGAFKIGTIVPAAIYSAIAKESQLQVLAGIPLGPPTTQGGIRYMDPRLWMGGVPAGSPLSMYAMASGGGGALQNVREFFGSKDLKEAAKEYTPPDWLQAIAESELGGFLSSIGQGIADIPDAVIDLVIENMEAAVQAPSASDAPGLPKAVDSVVSSIMSRIVAGLNVAASQYAEDPSLVGRMKSIFTFLLSGIAPSEGVKTEQSRLQAGLPPAYPGQFNFFTEAREGSRRRYTKAELQAMIGDMMAGMWDIVPESEEIGKVIEDLVSGAGDLGTKMMEAGVPADSVRQFLADAQGHIAGLNQEAGYSITTMWELVSAANALQKNLSDAAMEQAALARLSSGESLADFEKQTGLKATEIEQLQIGYAEEINDIADELSEMGMPQEQIDQIRFAAISTLQAIGSMIAAEIAAVPAGVYYGLLENPDYLKWIDAKKRDAIESEFENAMVKPRGYGAQARLEDAAMTSDERKTQDINDDVAAVAEAFGEGSKEHIAAMNAASRAIANLAGSAKKTGMTFEDMVGRLRSMITEKIKPDSGLSVTNEDMALTNLGKYVDGAWEPLRRLASAATDPNTKWKDLLPPGIGVASPEAKDYFETVKAGVERFDPAYSAFFPDRGKIVEGVISDLEGEQRQEQFVTSVIKEMADMGYDEDTLKKYFQDPQQALDESVSLLRDGVDDQTFATSDNTLATRDQTTAIGENTTSMGTLSGSVDGLTRWISSLQSGGKPPEDIPPDGEGEPKGGTIVYNPDVVIPPGSAPKPFARGGLVTSPTFAMMGEAGPELIVPLSRPGDKRSLELMMAGVNRLDPAHDVFSPARSVVPLSRSSAGRGFVPPSPQVNLRTMAPQIGAINMNTTVTSSSPAYVAQSVSRIQRRNAAGLGREILRAAAREGY